MQIDSATGLISPARYLQSPNQDERPEGELSLIVIHNISLPPNQFGGSGIDQLFTNALNPDEHPYYRDIYKPRVSSHLLIRRDGELVQYVPFHKRAWHAGESSYSGRERCNDYSVGIELEGADNIAYEDVQYDVLNQVIDRLCETYDELSRQNMAGHNEIAPERKTDPGDAFEWSRLGRTL